MTTSSTAAPARTDSAAELGIVVRPLREDDLAEADRVFRLAFGTILGLPEPTRFAEGSDLVRSRFLADPTAAFAAEVEGELVGSAFAARWGNFATFGPLTVRPDFWDRGVGRRLWEARLPLVFERWQSAYTGLFTFAEGAKHIHLYRKFGFWPRFLTALTAKPVAPGTRRAADWSTYSELPEADRERCLEECHALTDTIYPGLDVEREIRVVAGQGIGETVLLHDAAGLAGFAVCHAGRGSEAGAGSCYVKFGAARPGARAGERFERLLDACEDFAATRGSERLDAGVNLARQDACLILGKHGYRTWRHGVAMHRPNEPGHNRPDVYVIDDWR